MKLRRCQRHWILCMLFCSFVLWLCLTTALYKDAVVSKVLELTSEKRAAGLIFNILSYSQGTDYNSTNSPSQTLQRLHRIPKWQRRLILNKQSTSQATDANSPYFLTVVILVRIYATDKAKWSLAELKQWLHYLFWSGVEHVYFCNHYLHEDEKLEIPLKKYINSGLLTYLTWNNKAIPGTSTYSHDIMKSQVDCYDTIVKQYRNQTVWQVAIDMDEYPYCPNHFEEGFLRNYLKNISEDISEIKMDNFLMLGQGDRTRNLTIERINRITPKPANQLTKPIYRTKHYRKSGIHHVSVNSGYSVVAKHKELKQLHYWGARLQNWGPDTQDVLMKTEEFNDLREHLAPILRESLLAFGENDSFSAKTGP